MTNEKNGSVIGQIVFVQIRFLPMRNDREELEQYVKKIRAHRQVDNVGYGSEKLSRTLDILYSSYRMN